MGIAIAGKLIKDGDSIAIQGKLPIGIAIQGKIVYIKEVLPPPPPVISSTSHAYIYYYVPWNTVQFYGSNFRDTDTLVIEGIDHPIVFVNDTNIHSSSTAIVDQPMGRIIPVYIRSIDGQISNCFNIQVLVSPE